ncbi:DUF6424 family protein [Trebonia sp.]|jgi:hypothetical protein
MTSTHPEKEDCPWVIAVVDHPQRTDSPAYTRSRALMQSLVATTKDWVLSSDQYQDHHGGSVWVKDAAGWLCLQLPLGIEWSAQFCADPAKVDLLRQYAGRVVAAFPQTLPGYESFGYHDGQSLLSTPITDANGIAAWTDSIFNASYPLPAASHTGMLPQAAGYHHYPKPIVDIDHFRFGDFKLFVTDSAGLPAVVVPVSPRGSGDGRVRLLAAHVDSAYFRKLASPPAPAPGPSGEAAHAESVAAPPAGQPGDGEQPDVLPADDPLAQQAFAAQ